MIDPQETIVAIASPTTPSARGVVRLSGNGVVEVLNGMGVVAEATRSANTVSTLIETEAPIGSVPCHALIWPTSRSYTGQPSAELHTFGSLPVLEALVDAATTAGARAARPGEFTMRAFLAGRLDLTQAEAVLGVIDAQERGALDHALRQLAGNLSRPLESLRSTMLDLLADVEAGLDFVDEDIEFISDDALIDRLSEIVVELTRTQAMMLTRGGAKAVTVIAIRGEPNAGKSRLLNCLVDDEVAIVANVAGTTRDVVTVDAELDGHPVRFVDTAGIESQAGDDPGAMISRRSQQQATRASDEANMRIWCIDSTRDDFDRATRKLKQVASERRQSSVDFWVATKLDLCSSPELSMDWIETSAVSGRGIDRLRRSLVEAIAVVDAQETGSVVGTAARCRDTLSAAIKAANRAIQLTRAGGGHEFVSAELRMAVQCLGEVTGAVYTDDILDRVFGRFCIGK